MHFLVADDRHPAPVYVFLDADSRHEDGFPGLPVTHVILDRHLEPAGHAGWYGGGCVTTSIGRSLAEPEWFREFRSDGAVTAAECRLTGPRYVGPMWMAYLRAFRPGRARWDERRAVRSARPCGHRTRYLIPEFS